MVLLSITKNYPGYTLDTVQDLSYDQIEKMIRYLNFESGNEEQFVEKFGPNDIGKLNQLLKERNKKNG